MFGFLKRGKSKKERHQEFTELHDQERKGVWQEDDEVVVDKAQGTSRHAVNKRAAVNNNASSLPPSLVHEEDKTQHQHVSLSLMDDILCSFDSLLSAPEMLAPASQPTAAAPQHDVPAPPLPTNGTYKAFKLGSTSASSSILFSSEPHRLINNKESNNNDFMSSSDILRILRTDQSGNA